VVPGLRSCQFCGAAVEYIEPEAVESEPAASFREEAAPDEPASTRHSSASVPQAQDEASAVRVGSRRKRFIGVPAVVGLVVGAIMLLMALHLLRVYQNTPHESDSIPTGHQESNAAATSGTVSAVDLGVDLYPGVRAVSSEGRRETSEGWVVSATFVSGDEMNAVIDFYKARMVGYTSIYASGSGVVISMSSSAQESVVIGIAPAQSGGKTKITITNTWVNGAK
jgi:hypothetical protein